MLECLAPKWTIQLFVWLQQEIINQDMVNEALWWMFDKGLITCYDLGIS